MKTINQLFAEPGRRGFASLGKLLLTILWMLMPRLPLAQAAELSADAAIPVATAIAAREDIPIYLSGIGTVQAAQSVTIRARVDGQLEKVLFTEGQEVKAGDLLARIDPRPYQATLDQVSAQKAHDEASLTAAVRDLARYTTLVAQNSIQQQTLDTQQATVAQLKASIQSDQAQIDNARVQLGYTTIRAPVSGRTGLRLVDAGNIVRATDSTGLVVINQVDPIAVLFTLPESTFQTVDRAMQAGGHSALAVTALAREDKTPLSRGRLLLVNNQIDASTGTFSLKALFPNPSHALWPGQYVNVQLVLGMHRNAITVPATAVQRSQNGLLVYVVNADESVGVQPVRVGQTQDDKAIIDEGLTAGTRVITDGQLKVKPGARITETSKAGSNVSMKASPPRP